MKQAKAWLWILLVAITGQVWAQEENDARRFFFKNFQDTYVYYKDGRSFCVPANYDLVKGSFVFIDKENGNTLKLFGEQDKIGSVKVGNRVFLATPYGPTEVIQADPLFEVYYKPRLREATKAGGYGTESSASATRSMSHLVQDGPTNYLEKSDGSVAEVTKVYTIKVGKKEKQFSNEKQFLKIYPKQAEALQKYITEQQTDFDTIMQVLSLCNYAQSLLK